MSRIRRNRSVYFRPVADIRQDLLISPFGLAIAAIPSASNKAGGSSKALLFCGNWWLVGQRCSASKRDHKTTLASR